MALIVRTPMVDDDGSGEVGTVINNDWKTELYNQIDAVVAGGVTSSPAPIGSGGNISLVAGTTAIRITTSGALVVTGITLPGVTNGYQLLVYCVAASAGPYVRFAHDDAAAAAADRMLCVSARGQVIASGGAVRLVYDTSVSRWRLFLVTPGLPIPVPYAASDYTASAGTWTVDAGDMILNSFVQDGAMLTWYFRFATTSVSNAGAVLYVKLPNGFSAAAGISGQFSPQLRVKDGAAADAMGMMFPGLPSATQGQLHSTLSGAGWAVSANATEVQGMVRFPIA